VAFSPDGKLLRWRVRTAGTLGAAREHLQDIGHSLASLLLAGLAGRAARRFYAHRDERHREAAGVAMKVLEAGL
jgi:hypothetical protein